MPKSDDAFLKDDYTEPVTSRYMQFEEGDNRFRVLPAKPGKEALIMGWEYWKTVDKGRKPFRVTKDKTVQVNELETNPKTGEIDMPRFFWAFAVYNYKAKAIQILEVKQKTIRDVMTSLSRNPKWGSPMNYDLVVTRIEDGGKTSYSVTPDPKELLDEMIIMEWSGTPCNLEALYDQADPWSMEQRENLEKISEKDLEGIESDLDRAN